MKKDMSFKYCQSNEELNGKCEQQCNHCKEYYKPLEDEYNYFGEENELTRKSFNLDEVLDFCKTHRVEVLMMEDYQYGCFINAKPGDGCYATGLTPVYTLMCGIREYIKHKENGKVD